MIVSKIPGCCSSITIRNNPAFTSKSLFIVQLLNAIKDYNTNEGRDNTIKLKYVKNVIIITNLGFFSRPFWLKKAYSYEGNSFDKARVCYVKFPKGLA
jgi:hypothetical protein